MRSRPYASGCAACRRSSSPARRARCSRRSARSARGALSCCRPATASSRSTTSPRLRSASGSRCCCRCRPSSRMRRRCPWSGSDGSPGSSRSRASSPTEVVDGVEIPSFRGHIVHSDEPTAEARVPDPERLVQGYYQSVSTLNLLRAFTKGRVRRPHPRPQLESRVRRVVTLRPAATRRSRTRSSVRSGSCRPSASTCGASGRSTRWTCGRATRACSSTTRSP